MELHNLAQEVASCLAETNHRLVLAESCTAGQIAATLGRVPGISSHFCGSAVAYRAQTKTDWLQVAPNTIQAHSTESQETTAAIASGVLKNTKEATISLGITGHLGPGAPQDQDGQIYLSVWIRNAADLTEVDASQHALTTLDRASRQQEAACLALELLKARLSAAG